MGQQGENSLKKGGFSVLAHAVSASILSKFVKKTNRMTKFKQLLLVALAAAGCITACKGPVEKSLTGKSSIPDSVIISDTLARQYVQNYGKHARMLRSGNGSPLPDSRCFW